MNRWLQRLNFIGVLILATLCVFQWNSNRRLNLQINQQEKTRLSQTAELEEQSKKLKGYVEDLDLFRGDLTRANSNLLERAEKISVVEKQLSQLTAERDQLKSSISNWTKAVAERDARLKENNERLLKMGDELNAAIRKFNGLATNYNAVVKDLNTLRAAPKTDTAKD